MSRLVGAASVTRASPIASLFHPFRGKPDPQFLDTIEAVADNDIIPGVMEAAELTLMTAEDRKGVGGDLEDDPLPLDNLCSILKYVEEDTDPSFYSEMNMRSFHPDRDKIRPFVPFMWLFMKTLEMLDPWEGTVVNRGVKEQLKDQYPIGKEFIWHGFTSTTKDVGVLSNPMFLGTSGDRTLFQIELTQKQARDISKFSPLEEGEVVLPPGSRFRVRGLLPAGEGLTIIQLIELQSPAWIINLRPQVDLSTKDVTDIFSRFDLNEDGKISKQELTDVLTLLGVPRSSVRIVLAAADKDGSGDLDYAEFVAWICGGSDTAKIVASGMQDGDSQAATQAAKQKAAEEKAAADAAAKKAQEEAAAAALKKAQEEAAAAAERKRKEEAMEIAARKAREDAAAAAEKRAQEAAAADARRRAQEAAAARARLGLTLRDISGDWQNWTLEPNGRCLFKGEWVGSSFDLSERVVDGVNRITRGDGWEIDQRGSSRDRLRWLKSGEDPLFWHRTLYGDHPLKGLWKPTRHDEWWIGAIPYGSHRERAAHPDTMMRINHDGSGRWVTKSGSKPFGPMTWKMYYHWYGALQVPNHVGPSWEGTYTSEHLKIPESGGNEFYLDGSVLKRYSSKWNETTYWYRASG